jgi:hypothetical protein
MWKARCDGSDQSNGTRICLIGSIALFPEDVRAMVLRKDRTAFYTRDTAALMGAMRVFTPKLVA